METVLHFSHKNKIRESFAKIKKKKCFATQNFARVEKNDIKNNFTSLLHRKSFMGYDRDATW